MYWWNTDIAEHRRCCIKARRELTREKNRIGITLEE